ncbi:hypothetical protein BDF14DRAFT_1881054 [Spinellus fusiger]|nr:hypothetical protein BDF14DRAFT_1881054 [Spinellus fusiger]
MRKATSVMKKTFHPGSPPPPPPPPPPPHTPPTHSTTSTIPLSTHPTTHLSTNSSYISPIAETKESSGDTLDSHLLEDMHEILRVNSTTIDTHGPELVVLPSTSTYTLAGKEDKPEKLKKKAKNFLDERQKTKSRAQSLWNATNSFDQARFFQENAEQVFAVFYDTCIHQIGKMKQKSERPQSWNAKELVNLQKTLLLLRKIFLFVPELMRNGWQRKNIAKILAHLLDHGNHIRLRALGFHLLLLWMNDQVVEYPECMELFSNAISLDLFILDEIQAFPSNSTPPDTAHVMEDKETNKLHSSVQFVKKLGERHSDKGNHHRLERDERIKKSPLQFRQSFILGDETAPLYPNPTQPSFNDSVLLLHIFISNLVRLAYVAAGSPPPPDDYEYPGDNAESDDGIATGIGIDAATASAKFLFRIFRTYYLTKFLPGVARTLAMGSTDAAEQGIGFPQCPPSVLRCLLRFLIGYCLDNNSSPHTYWPHVSSTLTSPATPILKSIVLSSHETREMLHEVLRQCMVLPCSNPYYRDITRGALHIIGVWILGNEKERPAFLRRTGGTSTGTIGQTSTTRSSSVASVSTCKNSVTEPKPLTVSPTTCTAPRAEKQESDYADANIFLRRYLLMIKLLFESGGTHYGKEGWNANGQIMDGEGLLALYKDAINVYRAITVAQGGVDMEWESWELLLHCLLEIQTWFMHPSQPMDRMPMQALAEDMADFICETLLHAFVRAQITHMSLWVELKDHLLASIQWSQTLSQWIKIMHKLTQLLSLRLYQVNYDSPTLEPLPPLDEPLKKRHSAQFTHTINTHRGRNKVRTRHLSIQGDRSRTMASRAAGRPLSAGGSEGQLVEPTVYDKSQSAIMDRMDVYDTPSESITPASLHHKTSMPFIETSVSGDHRATNVSTTDIPQIEGLQEEGLSSSNSTGRSAADPSTGTGTGMSGSNGNGNSNSNSNSSTSTSSKLGIKHILPATSFSANTTPVPLISLAPPTTHLITTSSSSSSSNGSAQGHLPATSGISVGSGHNKRSSGRRTMSIHQLDSLWQDSSSKFLNLVHHSSVSHHEKHQDTSVHGNKALGSGKDEEENKQLKGPEWDARSTASSIERGHEDGVMPSGKSARAFAMSAVPKEPIRLVSTILTVNEKLPDGLGVFENQEFLSLHGLDLDGQEVLEVWKNMLCAVGNINDIQDPRDHAVAVQCSVDLWDILNWIRSQQPYRNVPIPALAYDAGKAAAFGCLCRLLSRRPEEPLPLDYHAHFYKAILKGLSSNDTVIIQAILTHSDRIFSFCLPGIHLLVPPFIDAIEKQLFDNSVAKEVPIGLRKSCITILGSLVAVTNHLSDTNVTMEEYNITWIQSFPPGEHSFKTTKRRLKSLLLRLTDQGTSVVHTEEDAEVYCMLLGALSSLVLDELLMCNEPDQKSVHESILAICNSLYWCSVSVLNTAVDCLNLIAHIYKEELDPEGIIVQEVLTKVIDSLNVHLKSYERNNKNGRGFIVSKLFSCLLEWVMAIEPAILSDTELYQLVFEVLGYAIHIASEDPEKMLPSRPVMRSNTSKKKELPFKFKLMNEKGPSASHNHATIVTDSEILENDHCYIKESAEAVLLHLLHHFNNFPPPYGPATLYSTIIGPGVAVDDKQDKLHQYQYFSLNDTTIIAYVEIPATDTKGPQSRMIIRDLTGRYVWDSQLEPPSKALDTSPLNSSEDSVLDPLKDQSFKLGTHKTVREEAENTPTTQSPDSSTMADALSSFLSRIGEENPDCVWNPRVPLHQPSPLSSLQTNMVGELSHQLNKYLANETKNNEQYGSNIQLWYSKMNVLRQKEAAENVAERVDSMHAHLMANFSLQKDFLPAFPHESENPNVPFQQCRLLMSHLGLMNYEHLKDGSLRMLNKSSGLYRDLRPNQEDEQSILYNSKGSAMYSSFVKSLGWEVDIATHTGYLGGLERNLTNGIRTNYYCTSTLEIIFHDVTQMPTDQHDLKQLKKKRHIGNDHVHIVWNEHYRDYRIGTIGGDFGNGQIVVTPMDNDLFAIQVHRDPKIPYFGPLFDRMVVSSATLGPLVRATAANAFRASVHTNLYSFYKCVYAQRANDVRTISHRHKVASWSYEQFMEKIFMPDE